MEELGLSFFFAPFLPLSPRKQNCQLRKLAANSQPRFQDPRSENVRDPSTRIGHLLGPFFHLPLLQEFSFPRRLLSHL